MKNIVFIFIVSLTIGCKDDNPVEPENHNSEVMSVVVFPDIVNPNDSLIVVCNATDIDGDTLVYDWYTSGIVKIKGGRPRIPALFNTYENSQIFYAPDSQYVTAPIDSFRIECAVRDRIGGQNSKVIFFKVRNN